MGATTIPSEQVKEQLLQDPETRRAYEDLELAYQITRLRIRRGLTQQELADLVGVKQPTIARLESGRTNPTVRQLNRVLKALDASLSLDTDSAAASGPEVIINNVSREIQVSQVRQTREVESEVVRSRSTNAVLSPDLAGAA